MSTSDPSPVSVPPPHVLASAFPRSLGGDGWACLRERQKRLCSARPFCRVDLNRCCCVLAIPPRLPGTSFLRPSASCRPAQPRADCRIVSKSRLRMGGAPSCVLALFNVRRLRVCVEGQSHGSAHHAGTQAPRRRDEEPDAAGRPGTDLTTGRPGAVGVRPGAVARVCPSFGYRASTSTSSMKTPPAA